MITVVILIGCTCMWVAQTAFDL